MKKFTAFLFSILVIVAVGGFGSFGGLGGGSLGGLGSAGAGFTPASLPNLVAWYPYSPTGDYFTRASGLIQTWADQSGNGNDLTQATAANRPIDGSVGSNLFTGASGTNWAGSGNGPYTHTAGSTVDLAADVLTVGTIYLVEITVASRTAGSVTPKAGTAAGSAVSANGTTTEVLTAAGNTSAIFTPTSDFDGSVTANFKAITQDGTVYCDAIQRYLKATFTIDAPYSIYILYRSVTWGANDYIFDGGVANRLIFRQNPTTPNLQLADGLGIAVATNTELAVGDYGVAFASRSGTTGTLQINNNAPQSGSLTGSSSMAGFTLGGNANGGNLSNIQAKEIIIYSAAHDAATRSLVINHLLGINQIAAANDDEFYFSDVAMAA